jgi:hypothetical protein
MDMGVSVSEGFFEGFKKQKNLLTTSWNPKQPSHSSLIPRSSAFFGLEAHPGSSVGHRHEGFEKTTPIQAFSMPIIAAGRDLIGADAQGFIQEDIPEIKKQKHSWATTWPKKQNGLMNNY